MKPLRTSEATPHKQVTALLDLAGDPERAAEWARRMVPHNLVHTLDKAGLKWRSKRRMLACPRSLSPDAFAVLTADVATQSGIGGLILLGALSGARVIVIGDHSGKVIRRSRVVGLILEATRFTLELFAGYGVILPLSVLATFILGLLLPLSLLPPKDASRLSSKPA